MSKKPYQKYPKQKMPLTFSTQPASYKRHFLRKSDLFPKRQKFECLLKKGYRLRFEKLRKKYMPFIENYKNWRTNGDT